MKCSNNRTHDTVIRQPKIMEQEERIPSLRYRYSPPQDHGTGGTDTVAATYILNDDSLLFKKTICYNKFDFPKKRFVTTNLIFQKNDLLQQI